VKNIVKTSVALAVGLFGLSASSNAQTLIVGSSAFYTQAGLAAASPASASGLGSTCVWSYGSNAVKVVDTTTGSSISDNGSVFIAWKPGSDCSTTSSASSVYAYLNTDSVVGNRALFNSDKLAAGSAGNPTTLANTNAINPTGSSQPTNVPSAIWNLINGATVNAAATDIRPEDAEFAITRALTPCGTALNQYTGTGTSAGSATQYLGLGYSNGGTIKTSISGSTSAFNVINFTLPSSFSVSAVGATPIVVAVNGTGWNGATNLNRSTLALFLDGSIGNTQDAGAIASAPVPTTVFVREPLSGTYNTMEYNVPNTVSLQTSQDVGVNQPSGTVNCSGTAPKWNGTNLASLASGAVRERAIGTGQELSTVFATNNSLGYGFWSAANFSAATSSAKYLTIDGVDPLFTSLPTLTSTPNTTYTYSGTIPTTGNGLLSNVTLANVANGTYPIWSLLRLATIGSSAPTAVSSLATKAGAFVSTTRPDFIAAGNLTVERAHFTPAGIYASTSVPTPQNGVCGQQSEVGGDVGGVAIPCQADNDYANDTGATFTSTTAPSSLRRN